MISYNRSKDERLLIFLRDHSKIKGIKINSIQHLSGFEEPVHSVNLIGVNDFELSYFKPQCHRAGYV